MIPLATDRLAFGFPKKAWAPGDAGSVFPQVEISCNGAF